MRDRKAGTSVFFLFALVLTACGIMPASGANAGERTIRIGFSNSFSANTWRAESVASARLAAEKLGNVELIYVDGQNDVNKQVSDLESLIAQEVDAIMLIPNTSDSVSPILRRAREEGIFVVVFGTDLDDDEAYDVYVGRDDSQFGVDQATWLVDKLNGKGKIIQLGGLPGNLQTKMIMTAANEIFARHKDIEIIAYEDSYWQEDRAKTIMANLLIAHPQIDGVFCDGGQVAAGAIKAMIDAGRELVPFTGDDYNGMFKLFEEYKGSNPKFIVSGISNPTWASANAVEYCVRLVKGEKLDHRIIIKPTIINDGNAQKYVRKDLPDGVFIDTDLTEEQLKELL